jgi:hypothetical protein
MNREAAENYRSFSYCGIVSGRSNMKVIFLDVDGVLNQGAFLEANETQLIDRKNVAVLKEIIDKTKALIVLSSGWKLRFGDDMQPLTEEACRLYNSLRESGITLFGKTPDFSTEDIRKNSAFSKVKAKEIKAWLAMRNDVDSFIVLDDLDLNDKEINSRLIRINSITGLTGHDAARAVRMLNLFYQ